MRAIDSGSYLPANPAIFPTMSAGTLRVATLNCGSLIEPGWQERRHEIVAWLERLQPDVVCFQEIWQDSNTVNTAGWIAAQLGDERWHWRFGGAAFGAELWPDDQLLFGSAILSHRPIDTHAYHRLPTDANDPDQSPAALPSHLLHVETAGLDIFSCHLSPAPTHGRHRRLQVLAIDEIIRGTRGHHDDMPTHPFGQRHAMPPVLCGDFNAEPDSDEIRFLSSLAVLDGRTTFYQDAWRVAGDGVGHTQDWRDNPIAASMNIHRKRIDYVFVGDPFKRTANAGRVLRAALAFHEPITGVVASDHRGLVVDIVWPDRPTEP